MNTHMSGGMVNNTIHLCKFLVPQLWQHAARTLIKIQ